MIYDYVVVGTSFSAAGCISGLLKSKKKILCIDGSEILNKDLINNDEYSFDFSKQNIPIKTFSFNKKYKDFFKPMEVLESHSFGRLSNVWGGSALRFLKKDFSEWPISYEELINFYDECEKIMNVTHYNDDISNELKIDNNQKNDSVYEWLNWNNESLEGLTITPTSTSSKTFKHLVITSICPLVGGSNEPGINTFISFSKLKFYFVHNSFLYTILHR